MRIVYVRVAYILLPLSVVFIKYFPAIGRVPNRSGSNIFAGVALHKNGLGCTVFILGLFLFIDLLYIIRTNDRKLRLDAWIRVAMLATGIWLLITCASLTSMLSLSLGCALLWTTGHLTRKIGARRTLQYGTSLIVFVAILEYGFNATATISELSGRGSGFSGRTWIWELVREVNTDPVFGGGFYSFWSTPEAEEISALFKGTLASAHNGLLEMYLDGGGIGFGLLVAILILWAHRSTKRMLAGTFYGQLCLCFLLLAVVNNFSETHYFRFTPLWFTLLALMIDIMPRVQISTMRASISRLYAATGG
jgi:O-antigen ligase